MNRFFLLILLVAVALTGCSTVQPTLDLESGPYPAPNRSVSGAALGAAIGAAPGVIAGNGPVAWGGALLGGAVGGFFGHEQDQKGLAQATKEAREYREKIRQEWMETYRTLASSGSRSSGKEAPPRVIVVNAERGYLQEDYDILLSVEQGLRQRGFVVVVPNKDNWNYYQRVGRDYSAYDADFLAEVFSQDLESAVKITLTLRSLTGLSELDRQGVGYIRYHDQYGWRERRILAAQKAAKMAVENLFIYRYADALKP